MSIPFHDIKKFYNYRSWPWCHLKFKCQLKGFFRWKCVPSSTTCLNYDRNVRPEWFIFWLQVGSLLFSLYNFLLNIRYHNRHHHLNTHSRTNIREKYMWLRIMDVLENSNEWILKSSTKGILVVIIVSIKGNAKSSNIGIPSNHNIQLHIKNYVLMATRLLRNFLF